MPRTPPDVEAYQTAMAGHVVREWELTNTRYLVTLAPLVDGMNRLLDPEQNRFRLRMAFTLSQTPDGAIQVHPDTNGPFGLVEFTGALPRAAVFTRWKSGLRDEDALATLVNTNFDPHAEVLVAEAIPAPEVAPLTGTPAGLGTAKYKSYTPKRFVIETHSDAAGVLLVNDKFDPSWSVLVDGRATPLLRANFTMRAVRVPSGSHEVDFRFEPPTGALWISVAAMAVALGVCGYVLFARSASIQSRSDL